MRILGFVISVFAFLLDGLLIVRGTGSRLYKLFPLFYSYLIYAFLGTLCLYVVYWLVPNLYPSAYWIYYLVTILVEFAVLMEISDQIFRSFPAIRYLGRALAVLISAALGLFYILPTTLWSANRRIAILDFTMRASLTKAIILVVLFYVARQYGARLGRNLGGLMLGFSIYVGVNVAIMAGAKEFGRELFGNVLWVMTPVSAALCQLVWVKSLWELVPADNMDTVSPDVGRDSQAMALELSRFNSGLSKLLH